MKSEISVESTIHVSINGIDLTLTREQAKSLRDALNQELGEQANIPYYPPMQPYQPRDNDWQPFVTPTTPTYPTYPQVWCGLSMFPKDNSFTVNAQ
jgi:hypothetical protein